MINETSMEEYFNIHTNINKLHVPSPRFNFNKISIKDYAIRNTNFKEVKIIISCKDRSGIPEIRELTFEYRENKYEIADDNNLILEFNTIMINYDIRSDTPDVNYCIAVVLNEDISLREYSESELHISERYQYSNLIRDNIRWNDGGEHKIRICHLDVESFPEYIMDDIEKIYLYARRNGNSSSRYHEDGYNCGVLDPKNGILTCDILLPNNDIFDHPYLEAIVLKTNFELVGGLNEYEKYFKNAKIYQIHKYFEK